MMTAFAALLTATILQSYTSTILVMGAVEISHDDEQHLLTPAEPGSHHPGAEDAIEVGGKGSSWLVKYFQSILPPPLRWILFTALIIYYTPRVLNWLLDTIAVLFYGDYGRNRRPTPRRNRGGLAEKGAADVGAADVGAANG